MVVLAGRPFVIYNKSESVFKGHVRHIWIGHLILERLGHGAQMHLLQLGYGVFGQHHFLPP